MAENRLYHLAILLLLHTVCSENPTLIPSSVLLETVSSNHTYEGITFIKRKVSVNATPELEFKLLNFVTTWDLDASLYFQNELLNVKTFEKGKSNSLKGTVYVEWSSDVQNSTFTIKLDKKDTHSEPLSPGNYTLVLKNLSISATAFLFSAPVFTVVEKPKRGLQGDPLSIACRVTAYPAPDYVKWTRGNFTDAPSILGNLPDLVPTERYQMSHETEKFRVPNDTLKISRLEDVDNGLFVCYASNQYGSDTSVTIVNVKDRWAALWPFIGIVIEVVVLVTAILLYERHQMRSRSAKEEAASAGGAAAADGGTEPLTENAGPGGEPDKDGKQDELRLRGAAKA